VTAKLKINDFVASLGAEWAFMPKGKANPFIGVDFTGNFFSGESKFDPGDTGIYALTSTLKSESRFGVAIGGGVDIAFSKNIGAVIGVKYNLANLIGKKYDSLTTSSTEVPLNDKEFGTTAAKNISFIDLYAGVSFYLGQPKKKMTK